MPINHLVPLVKVSITEIKTEAGFMKKTMCKPTSVKNKKTAT
jgi:hypothetical protein